MTSMRTSHRLGLGLAIAALASPLVLSSLNNAVGPAEAQRLAPPSQAAIKYSFAPIVKQAAPAVVNVYVKKRIRKFNSPFANDPFFSQFFGQDFGVPKARIQNSLGSGVIINRRGIIVTNNHVVSGGNAGTHIKVALADRREFDAQIILKDKDTDIAILKILGGDDNFPFLKFQNSDRLQVGDLVLAIGNPFGVGQTVTSGIVSALARTKVSKSSSQIFIQTDAAINPGNSGGALIDVDGRLVGINTAIFSKSGGSLGIGFAIPSNLVRLYVNSAMTGRPVVRPWLGAALYRMNRATAKNLGIRRVSGAYVDRVLPGGPASRAGLRRGDVIVAIDDVAVSDPQAVLYRLTTTGIGRTATIGVVRSRRRIEVKLEIKARPKVKATAYRNLSGDHPLNGARVAAISPGLSELRSLEVRVPRGVVVVSVRTWSNAQNAGFRPGDVILEIEGQKVGSINELVQRLRYSKQSWSFTINRRGRVLRQRLSRRWR